MESGGAPDPGLQAVFYGQCGTATYGRGLVAIARSEVEL